MKHIDILRKLNQRSPEVTEEVIARWGSKELFEFVHNLPRHLPPSGMEQLLELLSITEELRNGHIEEFPAIACELTPEELEVCAIPEYVQINERFPHIGRHLIQTWGSYAFYMYCGTLFTDTRGGTRRGFPPEILMALTRLARVHEQNHPRLDARRLDIWADVFHDPNKL